MRFKIPIIMSYMPVPKWQQQQTNHKENVGMENISCMTSKMQTFDNLSPTFL